MQPFLLVLMLIIVNNLKAVNNMFEFEELSIRGDYLPIIIADNVYNLGRAFSKC